MNKIAISLGLMMFLGGCASSTGVLPIGKDTYTITTDAHFTRGGAGAAKSRAILEANEYCSSQGLNFVFITSSGGSYGEYLTHDLTFRCVPEGDLEDVRPDIETVPDVVVRSE
ncbi:hypothetical protein [Hyphomonas sp.]|uniref:hypothetical protein n=1 Tax=Hyphomonas sp. TaxID=87 RepID=UPI001BCC33B5|nr:hypothetical protein [Hyphomonas sp.]